MQWMKPTFLVRFNEKTGRSGHVWGDRYWSEILVGEPPPGEVAGGDTFLQRGGFFAAAPWRIFQATPSMFRAQCWAGGDAFFQRGGFFAAAPWRIFQAMPSMFRAR
jgi:hypothetical protein